MSSKNKDKQQHQSQQKFSQYKSEEELAEEREVIETKYQENNLVIEPDGVFGMFVIKNEGGKPIPDVFKGRFTTRELARKCIKDYAKDQTVLYSIREDDYAKKRIALEEKIKYQEQKAKQKETDEAAMHAFMIEQGIIKE